MRRAVFAGAALVALAAVLALGHLALIEIGREVVTLRTQRPDGSWQETRLWVVDHDGAAWLHSAGEEWLARFEGAAAVELERDGATRRYAARADREAHARIDALLREKYGLADRWVRLLAPCDEGTVPVRLDRLPGPGMERP